MLLFLVDLINIEIFRISFSFFYSFSFILRSRATSRVYPINDKKSNQLSSKCYRIGIISIIVKIVISNMYIQLSKCKGF